MKLMNGKKGLIMGVANERSMAWGIAKKLAEQGAELAFSYVGEGLKRRVEPLAESLNSKLLLDINVMDEDQIDAGFEALRQEFDKIDFLVHAIGFSDKNELRGPYINTSLENFLMTMQASAWSFTSVVKRAAPLMNSGSSILTLTYGGSTKVMPHYNVMGVAKAALEASILYLAEDLGPKNIRVNGLSAGPMKTLAASGIGEFRYILNWNAENSPLRRNISLDDVAGSGLYLLSDLSSGVTGEIHYVDAGYNIVGMRSIDSAKAEAKRAK